MDFSRGSSYRSPNSSSKCQFEPLHGKHNTEMSQTALNEIRDMKQKSLQLHNSELMDKATLY